MFHPEPCAQSWLDDSSFAKLGESIYRQQRQYSIIFNWIVWHFVVLQDFGTKSTLGNDSGECIFTRTRKVKTKRNLWTLSTLSDIHHTDIHNTDIYHTRHSSHGTFITPSVKKTLITPDIHHTGHSSHHV